MRRLDTLMNRTIICAILMLSAAGAAPADVTTTISGYGTVGGSFTSDGTYAYHHVGSEFQGASNQIDIPLESRIGLQALFDFGSGLSITVQEEAKQRGNDDFKPGTEWLYVQYAPDSQWKLRFGRVVLPTFLFSDSRDVGYAAPWFRAPNEVYGAEPFEYVDGGQVLWSMPFGPLVLSVESAFGDAKTDYEFDGISFSSNAKDVLNAAVSLQYGDVLIRVAQTSTHVPTTLPLSPTFDVSYVIHDKFTTVGVQYDNGKAIVLSEWTKRTENDIPVLNAPLSMSTQWYVAAGWRLGKLTPLLMYSQFREPKSIITAASDSRTPAISMRYDILHNVALKVQVSRAQASNDTYWVTPNAASDERINVYSLGADFVF